MNLFGEWLQRPKKLNSFCWKETNCCPDFLAESAQTTSLTRSTPSPSKKKKKKKPFTRRANQIQVDVNNPLASLVIPDGLENHQILRVKIYKAGIWQVTKDPTKFTDVMRCAVCHQPHSFDKCPILLNIPFLKKNFIAYCLQMNRT